MLSYATGYGMTESAILRVLYLINRLAEGDQFSGEMLTAIRAGELTPHQGKLSKDRTKPRLLGPTKSGAEQRRVLANGTANLQAAVDVFGTLGAPLQVSSEELTEAMGMLKRARFELYTLIRELKKEKSRKENNSA
jgi:hypothetical protein